MYMYNSVITKLAYNDQHTIHVNLSHLPSFKHLLVISIKNINFNWLARGLSCMIPF